MASLTGETIASSYDLIVKRHENYVQAGTNIELMTDSNGATAATGLYLESGAVTSNVGIGVSDPAYLLEVKKASGECNVTFGSGNNNQVTRLSAGSESHDSKLHFSASESDKGSIIYDHHTDEDTQKMKFLVGDNAVTAATILGNGNVGIGTTNPGHKLEVLGGSDDNYVAMFDNIGTGATAHGIKIICGDLNYTDDGSTHYIQFMERDGVTVVGDITNNGGSGALQLETTSDARLKENIKDTEVNGLNIINSLRMREFNWKKRYNKKVEKCGLIAQEVQQVFPSAVSEMDDDDKTLAIAQSGFIYSLIKAVQELSAKVTALENA